MPGKIPPDNMAELNQLLQSQAFANDGVNHVSDYTICELPSGDSLEDALGVYFSSMYTSISPPQPAEAWHIKTTLIENPVPTIRRALQGWFYQLEFSPTVAPSDQAAEVDRCMELLDLVLTDAAVYEVQVTPPMWYECVWQDFAVDGGQQRWMLHVGFSD